MGHKNIKVKLRGMKSIILKCPYLSDALISLSLSLSLSGCVYNYSRANIAQSKQNMAHVLSTTFKIQIFFTCTYMYNPKITFIKIFILTLLLSIDISKLNSSNENPHCKVVSKRNAVNITDQLNLSEQSLAKHLSESKIYTKIICTINTCT